LLTIGIACWAGRLETQGSGHLGLLIGVLVYDVAAAAILAYTGLFVNLVGIGLWPAVVLHAALALWCVAGLWLKPQGAGTGTAGRERAGSPAGPARA
jgi:hypothetical protein